MLEFAILSLLGVWLLFALRACVCRRGGCGACGGCHGCAHCKTCGK